MESSKLFPIGYVSKRTGLSPHVIRAWERRYGVVQPQRSSGNRRLYSREDVDHLSQLQEAVQSGHTISSIAHLPGAELASLLQSDRTPGVEAIQSWKGESTDAVVGIHIDGLLQATQALDLASFEKQLHQASVEVSRLVFLADVVTPLFERIGDQWAGGTVKIVQEHMASTATQAFLWDMLRSADPGEAAPGMVVATPTGQWCQLGALMVALVGADVGWNVHYFGPNLPPEEIAAAVGQKEAKAVALSLVHPVDGLGLIRELKRLMRSLAPGVQLIVGGKVTETHRNHIEALGLPCVGNLRSFVSYAAAMLHGDSSSP